MGEGYEGGEGSERGEGREGEDGGDAKDGRDGAEVDMLSGEVDDEAERKQESHSISHSNTKRIEDKGNGDENERENTYEEDGTTNVINSSNIEIKIIHSQEINGGPKESEECVQEPADHVKVPCELPEPYTMDSYVEYVKTSYISADASVLMFGATASRQVSGGF